MSTSTESNALGQVTLLGLPEVLSDLFPYNELENFANSSNFIEQNILAFGQDFNVEKLYSLQQKWREQDLSTLPKFEVRSSAELKGANGAFSQDNNTIYLSEEYLLKNGENPDLIFRVILEEIGHFVDAQINAQDAAGDEGAIFSALVRGISLTPQEIARLKAEDDTNTITLNGEVIQVEQSTQPLREWVQSVVDQIIFKIEDFVTNNFMTSNASLPILGSKKLNSLGQKIIDQLEKLRTDKLSQALNKLEDKGENEVRKLLFDELGPQGLNLLRDKNGDHQITENDVLVNLSAEDCNFQFKLGENIETFTTPIDARIGLPNLGLTINDGSSTQVGLGYELNLNFGQDTTGNYFNISSPKDLKITTDLSLPNFNAQGKLGFLGVGISDKNTDVGLDFLLNLQDSDNLLRFDGNDNPSININVNGEADVNLGLTASINNNLPFVSTDFHLNWVFNQAEDNLQDNFTDFGTLNALEFKDVQINLGNFFTEVVDTILGNVKPVLDVVRPVIDFLYNPIDLKIASLRPIDILSYGGYIDDNDRKFLDLIYNFLFSPTGMANTAINLGSFNLGQADPRTAGFKLEDIEPNITNSNITNSTGIDSQLPTNVKDFFSQSEGKGLIFPIFEDPKQAFNLILGKTVNLALWDLPEYSFGIPKTTIWEASIIVLTARLIGQLEATVNLDIGFDSSGLKSGNLLDGLYLDDHVDPTTGTDRPELTMSAGIFGEAEAGLNLDFASIDAGISGGIQGSFFFDLKDILNGNPVRTGDGRVELSELEDISHNPIVWFYKYGAITAFLDAYVRAHISLFGIDKSWYLYRDQLINATLFSYNSDDPNSQAPILADKVNDTQLQLNIGIHAPDRHYINSTDGEEVFNVSRSSINESTNGEDLDVQYLLTQNSPPFEYTKKFLDISQIIGNAGIDNDVITIDLRVLIPANLHGGAGDDQIYGGGGNDYLWGDAGNDFLVGGPGADTLEGGEDQGSQGMPSIDTISYSSAKQPIILELLQPNPSENRLINSAILATSDDATGDVFIDIESFKGSPYNDQIIGEESSNFLLGAKGNDSLVGNGGDDILDGEEDDDSLEGGTGKDYLMGSLGKDTLRGGNDDDQLFGENGNLLPEYNSPQNADDQLYGEDGNDTLKAGIGNDFLSGGIGNDYLYGDDGAYFYQGHKYLIMRSPTTWQIAQANAVKLGGYLVSINSEAEQTWLYNTLTSIPIPIDNSSCWIGLNDQQTEDQFVWSDGTQLTYTHWGLNQPLPGNDQEDFVRLDISNGQWYDEAAQDSSHNEIIFPSIIEINTSTALANNDNLWGGDGEDTLYGEEGNDSLFGEVDNDSLYGGLGNDSLDGGDGYDSLWGEMGDDRLLGLSGNDFLYGNEGNDNLDGGDGNDNLWGNAGSDFLVGGPGADTLEGGEDQGSQGIPSIDTISYSSAKQSIVLELYKPNPLENNRLINSAILATADDATGDIFIDIERFQGSPYNDQIIGEYGSNFLLGAKGNDSLVGNGGDDILDGEDDDDSLEGGTGKDYLMGSLGKDTLMGGVGDDQLFGEDGNLLPEYNSPQNADDQLYGEDGNDSLYGEEGNDSLFGEVDNDSLYGGLGNDSLDGGDGYDSLWGEMGDDRLLGLSGNDFLYGNEGNDNLDGGDGNDNLYGGLGDDLLAGGLDADYLAGNEGKDTLDGGDGIDILLGGFDNDSLSGGNGDDSLNGNDLNDFLSGGTGNDSLDGSFGDDSLYGEDDNDTLIGGYGRDILTGGNGNDLIIGNDAADTLTGGAGSDRFVYSNIRDVGDLIMDFEAGSDQVVLTELFRSLNLTISSYSYAIAQSYLSFGTKADDTILLLDQDGLGIQRARPFITFDNLAVATLSESSNFVI